MNRKHSFLAALLVATVAFAGTQIKDTGQGYQLGTAADQLVGFFGAAPVAQQTLAALTENSTTIGGTNDGNIPSLTATAATLTGTLTGTANGSLVDVAAAAAATAGSTSPSASDVDAGIATAVATIVSGVNEQNKEMQAQINALIADNAKLREAARENAAKINALLGKLNNLGLVAAP